MGFGNREIINYKCKYCGCEQSYKTVSKYFESGECVNCGKTTYYIQLKEYDLHSPNNIVTVECPYCHSKNTKKISSFKKIKKVALLGILSAGSISKQWHCNNCNSDF